MNFRFRVLLFLFFCIHHFIFAQKFSSKTNTKEEVFLVVEEMPIFDNGQTTLISFISKNIIYPETALNSEISGKLVLSFIINKFGKIENVEVIKSVSKEIDEEGIRVLKLSDSMWQPGTQNGRPCSVQYTIPINFKSGLDISNIDFLDKYLLKIDDYEQKSLKSDKYIAEYKLYKLKYEARFDSLLILGLKRSPDLFFPRAISLFFLTYFYELETNSELFKLLNEISLNLILLDNESKEYFTSKNAWKWWKYHKTHYMKFTLLEEWENREFNKNVTIPGYEK